METKTKATATAIARQWSRIPDHIVGTIGDFCNVKDLLEFVRVCHGLHKSLTAKCRILATPQLSCIVTPTTLQFDRPWPSVSRAIKTKDPEIPRLYAPHVSSLSVAPRALTSNTVAKIIASVPAIRELEMRMPPSEHKESRWVLNGLLDAGAAVKVMRYIRKLVVGRAQEEHVRDLSRIEFENLGGLELLDCHPHILLWSVIRTDSWQRLVSGLTYLRLDMGTLSLCMTEREGRLLAEMLSKCKQLRSLHIQMEYSNHDAKIVIKAVAASCAETLEKFVISSTISSHQEQPFIDDIDDLLALKNLKTLKFWTEALVDVQHAQTIVRLLKGLPLIKTLAITQSWPAHADCTEIVLKGLQSGDAPRLQRLGITFNRFHEIPVVLLAGFLKSRMHFRWLEDSFLGCRLLIDPTEAKRDMAALTAILDHLYKVEHFRGAYSYSPPRHDSRLDLTIESSSGAIGVLRDLDRVLNHPGLPNQIWIRDPQGAIDASVYERIDYSAAPFWYIESNTDWNDTSINKMVVSRATRVECTSIDKNQTLMKLTPAAFRIPKQAWNLGNLHLRGYHLYWGTDVFSINALKGHINKYKVNFALRCERFAIMSKI